MYLCILSIGAFNKTLMKLSRCIENCANSHFWYESEKMRVGKH